MALSNGGLIERRLLYQKGYIDLVAALEVRKFVVYDFIISCIFISLIFSILEIDSEETWPKTNF